MADHAGGLPAPVSADLFRVPAWTTTVPAASWWIPQLTADIDMILERDPQDPQASSGHQTRPELQLRSEPHWAAFLALVTATFEDIAAAAPRQRYPRYGLRSWALRITAESSAKDLSYGPARTLARHNHAPALLTSIFTCELPAEPEPCKLATAFHNPAAHVNCPWQPPIVTITPRVGMLLAFPGWLEHSVPVVAPIPPGQRRVTINTDYFPEFG